MIWANVVGHVRTPLRAPMWRVPALGGALWAAISPAAAQHSVRLAPERVEAAPADGLPDSGLRGALKRFLHDEARATVRFRSYFFDRIGPRPPTSVALAGGGWVGLESGWLYDTLQIGAVGYTTQPIWAPNNPYETSNGTRLLKPDGYGFFTLGQAYASARWMGQTFTAYRQWIDELEVNPRDNRMIPQTFEAYALRGRLAAVNYFAGYVAAIKTRDASSFVNMAEQAGAPNVDAGMGLVSVRYGDPGNFAFRSSAYYVPDILWSHYTDAVGTIPVTEDLSVRLSGQFMVQGSNGRNLLTGSPFGTFIGGGKVDAMWGPFTITGAFMQVGSAAAYRSPYGIFIGYNKQQVLNFDRAGERSFQLGARYDLAAVGLPGTFFMANVVYGQNAIDATTGPALPDTYEYDLELNFRADRLEVPDWLKPLQLRARVAFIDQYMADAAAMSTTEYRVVLNYEVSWQGSRRR
ncbi:MAG: OprD family outer membrane porin [Reyranella sp.]